MAVGRALQQAPVCTYTLELLQASFWILLSSCLVTGLSVQNVARMDKGTLILLAALQVLSLAILAQRFLPEAGIRSTPSPVFLCTSCLSAAACFALLL